MSDDRMLATILNELREARKELAVLREEVSALKEERNLPDEGDQTAAAEALGFKSNRAVRNMHDRQLIKGLHYWHVNNRPRYDLVLLRHGQRHGFGSATHLKKVNERRKQLAQLKSRPSAQRVKKVG